MMRMAVMHWGWRGAFAMALGGLGLAGGCAMTNPNNRPTYNLVRQNLWPKESGRRLAAAPAVIPLAGAALVADAVLVHPALALADVAREVKRLVWNDMAWRQETGDEIGRLPWRVVETPLYYGFFFVLHCMFDLDEQAPVVLVDGRASGVAGAR